ncbi:MAG: NAD-dependent epimerase/dehydratase family protein [bacterium]|nr:NAD-dependent epimerase/dehydratase family protein [bacterium]
MKRILITGANSYIGTSFEKWMKQYDGYKVDTVDTLDGKWKQADFSKYDTVFHVAGLAHADPKPEMRDLYYKVNTDLAVEVAGYAKAHGVKQFIFMSSIIVYGNNNSYINNDTIPTPKNFYGDSKLQADIRLHKMQAEGFNVVSIRPPMIYGKGSKGNYPRLSKLAKKAPIFPSVRNERSMLHIDNLCEFLRLVIENNESGIFYPQNKEYVNTAELVRTIAGINNKNVVMIGIFNPMLKLLADKVTTFNKLFGNLVYDKSMSNYMDFKYCVRNFEESIKLTEV